MNIQPPTAEQSRDLAAEDAHAALRTALLPHVLLRQDAPAIVERIASGTELALDFAPLTRRFAATLIDTQARLLLDAALADDPESRDLADVLGVALAAALNAEATDVRKRIGAAVNAGACTYVVRLRVLGGIESLVLALIDSEGRAAWRRERAVPFDTEHRLKAAPPSGDTLH